MTNQHRLTFGRPVAGGSTELSWYGAALVGVLNVTPDSFSDGGAYSSVETAVSAGMRLAEEGAIIVDVGGESTRPGAAPVGVDEECARVLPVIEALAERGVVVSVDTRNAGVAERAIGVGAALVNDVSGLRDPHMVALCAEYGVPAIIVHMRGEPATMQADPHYDDVVAEVKRYLVVAAERALAAGVPSVVVDPGIGFGKTAAHNVDLLRGTADLAQAGYPVMVGASRKAFIGRLSGVAQPQDRLAGSLAAHIYAASGGAALLRVHDVAAHRQALAVTTALSGGMT